MHKTPLRKFIRATIHTARPESIHIRIPPLLPLKQGKNGAAIIWQSPYREERDIWKRKRNRTWRPREFLSFANARGEGILIPELWWRWWNSLIQQHGIILYLIQNIHLAHLAQIWLVNIRKSWYWQYKLYLPTSLHYLNCNIHCTILNSKHTRVTWKWDLVPGNTHKNSESCLLTFLYPEINSRAFIWYSIAILLYY